MKEREGQQLGPEQRRHRHRMMVGAVVRAVMEEFANNRVREIVVRCTAQSAKT